MIWRTLVAWGLVAFVLVWWVFAPKRAEAFARWALDFEACKDQKPVEDWEERT